MALIWTYHLNYQPASRVREVAAELEELGYGALWVGEAAYREPLCWLSAVSHQPHGDRDGHRQHLGT